MIILTGDEGFIGKKFLEKLTGKDVVKVEKRNSWHFRTFNEWHKVELILHQGAISDTTCTNLCLLYTSPSQRDRQKSRMPSSA